MTKKVWNTVKTIAIFALLLSLAACSGKKAAGTSNTSTTTSTPAVSSQAASTKDTSAEDAQKAEEERLAAEQAEKEAAEEAERLAQEEAEKAAAEEAERLAAEEAAKAEEERLAAEAAAAEAAKTEQQITEENLFLDPAYVLEKVTVYATGLNYDHIDGEFPNPGSQADYYIWVYSAQDDPNMDGLGFSMYTSNGGWKCAAYTKGADAGSDGTWAFSLEEIYGYISKYANQ